jgi:ketosteroid isomerase-like protein
MPFRSARRVALLVLLAIANVSATPLQTPRAQSDQDLLIELERGWNDAVYEKDTTFIDGILADDYTATYEDGEVGDRAKELKLVAEFNQQVESAIQDDFTVRIYHDTAVVRFTLHLVGIKQGQRTSLDLRYSDVWVMSDGRWRCVSSQSTRVTPK